MTLVLLAARPALAQDSARHGPPPRLERPRPRVTSFAPRLTLAPAALFQISALELSLSGLAKREKSRVWPGSLQLGFAVALGVGAVFVKDPGLRAALTVGSVVSGARGLIELTFKPDVSGGASVFSALALRDERSMWLKLRAGERALAYAARVGMQRRMLEGSCNLAGALAYLPVERAFAAQAGRSHRFGSTAGDYVGLALSVIALGSGLVQMLTKSPAELEYEAYRALRKASAGLRF